MYHSTVMTQKWGLACLPKQALVREDHSINHLLEKFVEQKRREGRGQKGRNGVTSADLELQIEKRDRFKKRRQFQKKFSFVDCPLGSSSKYRGVTRERAKGREEGKIGTLGQIQGITTLRIKKRPTKDSECGHDRAEPSININP